MAPVRDGPGYGLVQVLGSSRFVARTMLTVGRPSSWPWPSARVALRNISVPSSTAAGRALGEIGSGEAMKTLRELYGSSLQSHEIRASCLRILVEKDLGSTLSTIKDVLDTEWPRQPTNNPVIQFTARELAAAESPLLQEIYQRLLGSPNLQVRIAAIRGVAVNGYGGLKEQLRKIAEDDPVAGVRQEALRALDRF